MNPGSRALLRAAASLPRLRRGSPFSSASSTPPPPPPPPDASLPPIPASQQQEREERAKGDRSRAETTEPRECNTVAAGSSASAETGPKRAARRVRVPVRDGMSVLSSGSGGTTLASHQTASQPPPRVGSAGRSLAPRLLARRNGGGDGGGDADARLCPAMAETHVLDGKRVGSVWKRAERALSAAAPGVLDARVHETFLLALRARFRVYEAHARHRASQPLESARTPAVWDGEQNLVLWRGSHFALEPLVDAHVAAAAAALDASVLKLDEALLSEAARSYVARMEGNAGSSGDGTSKSSSSNRANKQTPSVRLRLGALKAAVRILVREHLRTTKGSRATVLYFGNLAVHGRESLSRPEQRELLRFVAALVRYTNVVVVGCDLPGLPLERRASNARAGEEAEEEEGGEEAHGGEMGGDNDNGEESAASHHHIRNFSELDKVLRKQFGLSRRSSNVDSSSSSSSLPSSASTAAAAESAKPSESGAKGGPSIGITVIGMGAASFGGTGAQVARGGGGRFQGPTIIEADACTGSSGSSDASLRYRDEEARRIVAERNWKNLAAVAQGFRFELGEMPASTTSGSSLTQRVLSDRSAFQVVMTAIGVAESGAASLREAVPLALRMLAMLQPAVFASPSQSQQASGLLSRPPPFVLPGKDSLSKHEKKFLSALITPDKVATGFRDIACLDKTKNTLQTLITLPLLFPQHFTTGILRQNVSGVLLFGPPGTGKTMLAKAVARESKSRFLSVNLSSVFDMYVGEGEKNVKAIFSLARKVAPCVVFVDEVDALFGSRSSMGSGESARREIMNEFMTHWDGISSDAENRGIVIMAATNRPFDLDDAVLRRLPRRVMVDLPTEAERLEILRTLLRDETLSESCVASNELARLAAQTKLYSGSDLKNLCISAALHAVKEELGIGSEGSETVSILERFGTASPEAASITAQAAAAAELQTASDSSSGVLGKSRRMLTEAHFAKALREVPASIREESGTLVELRKWDKKFGEGARADGGVKGIGFA